MNKTLRNKALRDTHRLITATYNGQDWACPDGYFATSAPIYDGYRVKKNQYVPDHLSKPVMDKLLNTSEYAPADKIEWPENDSDFIDISNQATEVIFRVNKQYYDLLKHLHPGATVHIAIDGNKYADVRFIEDNKLVALIMPVKQ